MLIDDFMPVFERSETQEIAVNAAPAVIFRAVKTFDLNESTTIRWMFKLRGIAAKTMTLSDFEKVNLKVLGERQNQELVVGSVGKYQSLTDKLLDINPLEFAAFNEAGFIKTTWNFLILETNGKQTRLVSEIRIKTTDASSLAKVEKYWGMMKPPLEMIRKEILKLIKNKAER